MLMFTLAISCLITYSLSWFMDLTFQVPMQYCSLHHWTLLPSPVTSTNGFCFCFGSISSFFLELFLHSSPVAYWTCTNLGSSSFSVLSFGLFILFMGFSRQECWSGLPFPSPMDNILSELWPIHLGWPCTAWLIVSLSAALNMPANLENSAVPTGLENVSFHSNPKEGQCQKMFKLPHNCANLSN